MTKGIVKKTSSSYEKVSDIELETIPCGQLFYQRKKAVCQLVPGFAKGIDFDNLYRFSPMREDDFLPCIGYNSVNNKFIIVFVNLEEMEKAIDYYDFSDSDEDEAFNFKVAPMRTIDNAYMSVSEEKLIYDKDEAEFEFEHNDYPLTQINMAIEFNRKYIPVEMWMVIFHC